MIRATASFGTINLQNGEIQKNKSVDITGKREYARYRDLKTSYCNIFSYSEWWRYIGSVKPRQPLMEGANLSE